MLFHGRWWVGVSEIAWHGTARHDMTCWTNGLREAKKVACSYRVRGSQSGKSGRSNLIIRRGNDCFSVDDAAASTERAKNPNGLFCMVGYTGEDGKHYGRRITNPWHDCPPPLFLGQISFLSCDMGSCLSRLAWFCCFTKRRKPEKLCFITAVVGRLVAALLYLACLFSLSLLFSSPIMCFIVLTSPRHVLHALPRLLL